MAVSSLHGKWQVYVIDGHLDFGECCKSMEGKAANTRIAPSTVCPFGKQMFILRNKLLSCCAIGLEVRPLSWHPRRSPFEEPAAV